MFTGIVEEIGEVYAIDRRAGSAVLTISARRVLSDMKVGDSISVNGACLTVVRKMPTRFCADVMEETLLRTNIGYLKGGDKVNLERAVPVLGRWEGHIVQGHVDGTAVVAQVQKFPRSWLMKFKCDEQLTEYMVPKGSIAVDGVSLTIVDCGRDWFSAALIPHTLRSTTLGLRRPGDMVNIEVDLLAKYIRKFVQLHTGISTHDEVKHPSGESLLQLLRGFES